MLSQDETETILLVINTLSHARYADEIAAVVRRQSQQRDTKQR